MISEGEHPLNIDQLLVMTFTSAAAAEMRERIGAAVEKRLREDPMNEHLWLQAALIPQAQIMTIDSFCLNLIRNHYNRLDIDPAFRIGDEGELTLLKGDVMEELLEECYQEGKEEFLQFAEQFGAGKVRQGHGGRDSAGLAVFPESSLARRVDRRMPAAVRTGGRGKSG